MKHDITIGQLARQHGLSRATLLYYDRLGLLRPRGRSGGNYRLYSAADAGRLEQIRLYRNMGVPLQEIARLLDRAADAGQAQAILQRRLGVLETQIESLQEQQRQIVRLLGRFPSGKASQPRGQAARSARAARAGGTTSGKQNKENAVINKKRWVEIMTAAGFDEQAKQNWHRQFEKMEPEAHQEFLESLGIDAAEISRIREWSRK